ncbi:helix-turn-helix domain-containing protein [Ruegeria arenilitoris]|uniref:helix-turn-helix domain-containing protein n=1 Tax=Ruegeria arenilitoris TaxID=1173585 RepID=UPI00147E9623|nr:helix-turn-helix transcriptional regulator [Ruegeria arenilitoris]
MLQANAGKALDIVAISDVVDALARDGRATIQRAADELRVSRRSLQRYLAASGVTFSDLRDQSLNRAALTMLAHSELSIASISERLGYNNPSSFTRAFARWNGITPVIYRRRIQK